MKTRALRWLFPRRDRPAIRHSPGNRRRVAVFIKQAGFSHINASVEAALRRAFPEFDIVTLDVFEDVLRFARFACAANLPAVLRLHGRAMLRRQSDLRGSFLLTPGILEKLRRLIPAAVAECGDVAFTFQTQSLFDASTGRSPHFVYTDHAHLANLSYPAFTRDRLLSRQWIDAEGGIYRRATKTFVMSNHVRRSLIDRYFCDPARAVCVFAGSNIRAEETRDAAPRYDARRIAFVGVDWERKGGPVLLDAFRRVRHRLPDATLDIVGCSPPVSEPGVTVTGRVPLAEVSRHLLDASVFCLPTRIEPFGIAPLEAMARRLPVVATRVGALPDFVEENRSGLLVESDDAHALADTLTRLLDNPEMCRRFGERGHEIFSSRYTWEAVSDRLRAEILPLLT